jgi:hypothetical protein
MKNKKSKTKLNVVEAVIPEKLILDNSLDSATENSVEFKLWFKNKKYGYGWTPVSRNGWIVVLVFVIFLILQIFDLTYKLEFGVNSIISIVIYIFNFATALTALSTITTLTGEKPKGLWITKK